MQTTEITNQKLHYVVVDDDPNVSVILRRILEDDDVKSFQNIAAFTQAIPNLHPKGIFIDIHIGYEDNGLDLIETIRDKWKNCPFIVITADEDEELILEALKRGANDFIRKPLSPNEVRARLSSRIKDIDEKIYSEVIEVFDLKINRTQRKIEGPNGTRFLTPMDISIFIEFHKNLNEVVERQKLKENCWGSAVVSDNAMNRKLFEIRQMIKELSNQARLKTVYGVGFSLENK